MRCGFRVQREGLNRRSGRSDLGSLPDVSTMRQLPVLTPIPRNEAMLLCQQKRHELQMILEHEQERRRRTIVLRLGDLKVLSLMFLFIYCNNSGLARGRSGHFDTKNLTSNQ